MKQQVLFIHGSGDERAYTEDALLAASLRRALGAGYALHYPHMPLEADAAYADWKARLAIELAARDDAIILVAHSVGGAILLRYLSEEPVGRAIGGLFLLATPCFGADPTWTYPDMALPQNVAARLPAIPRIALYHCRDDAVVPFAHLARYAATLPRATTRAFERGGHQFDNDLAAVAADIRGLEQASGACAGR